jgi:hypothetical protein
MSERAPSQRVTEATRLMLAFAGRTGLEPPGPQRRYLWTDAFAVGNFLGLARATGDERHAELALRLVDQVHHVLGRHRPGDERSGWISGLAQDEGEAHPTRAGLRIGKALAERRADQPFDDALEWDRDGQYLHYLTRWIHALCQVARFTGRPAFATWARELAAATHRFVWSRGALKGSYWKMSVDLSRPLVRSMGQHDALDALVACLEADEAARRLEAEGPSLGAIIVDFAGMIEPDSLASADPLGIGGLLIDASLLDQLVREGAGVARHLEEAMLAGALGGLERYVRSGALEAPAPRRLAFREAGLAIGLRAAARMHAAGSGPLRRSALLQPLAAQERLADEIVTFWLNEARAQALAAGEHADIDQVMLATALHPEGYLSL